MISQILETLEAGLETIRTNTKLLLVAILVFVFPLLFIWMTQQFFTTAQKNITTAEKQRIGILHDSLAALVAQGPDGILTAAELIPKIAADNPDITQMRILQEDEDSFAVTAALNQELTGSTENSTATFKQLPISANESPHIFPMEINGVRTWQVFRTVHTDHGNFIIFTEHQFRLTDSVMAARRQQSYFGLTAIFVFLIVLAYWLNRQVHWHSRYANLAQKMHERDLFSNMIAHEFRTPLTAIKGYASFLQESQTLQPEDKRYATTIRISAERLVLLVNDFLEVARLQSGKLSVDKKPTDVRNVLERVATDLGSTAAEKGLTIVYNKTSTPIMLTTDSDRLIQVLTNIISNSLKYTTQGSVELECVEKRHEVTVRIKDTGMGISAEDQQKLFAPFTRVGGVDKTTTTGTGLGMWITKQLVTLLDGTIGVESIKGVGTHVVMTFPRD